jgi:hypothetical protein
MQMAQGKAANDISIKLLDNMLEADMQAGMQLVSMIAGMPVPGAGEIGGLMDVRG